MFYTELELFSVKISVVSKILEPLKTMTWQIGYKVRTAAYIDEVGGSMVQWIGTGLEVGKPGL